MAKGIKSPLQTWDDPPRVDSKENISDRDIDYVANALKMAREHNLEAEVVWSAMRIYAKYHKSAPETYNMGWALDCALSDWDI